ncbi:MAG TPA: hypothetical protein VGI86_15685 [Acidimicrobiia bacterium]
MVVLGCVLGLLVAGFVARAVFGGSSGSKSASSSTTSITSPADRTNPFEPTPGTATTIAPSPPTFPVYGSKNPFEPVIQVESPTSTTTPPSSGGTTTTTTPGTSGSTTTTTIAPSNNPVPSQTVTLIDVFRNSNGVVQARVQVGSTVFTVGEGDTFASGAYRVVSLDSPCGQFLFGDSPFTLCVGEQTLK